MKTGRCIMKFIMFNDYDKQIELMIDKSLFFVKATDFEKHMLWVEHASDSPGVPKSRRIEWKSGSVSFSYKISKELYISIQFDNIGGQQIAFYYPIGNIINWEKTYKWRDKVTHNRKWDKKSLMGDGVTHGRPINCDPWNFHHCLAAIAEANEE